MHGMGSVTVLTLCYLMAWRFSLLLQLPGPSRQAVEEAIEGVKIGAGTQPPPAYGMNRALIDSSTWNMINLEYRYSYSNVYYGTGTDLLVCHLFCYPGCARGLHDIC